MITGIVTPSLSAIVRLHIADSTGTTQAMDFKIDTAFTDFINLPFATVQALGLPLNTHEIVQIADGSFVRVPVYSGVVIWDSKARKLTFTHWVLSAWSAWRCSPATTWPCV
ncbi:MAG: hypothetical protein HY289_08985 [Planctomycetes bacterium]|nr:hypothetical protein [Planctomycetota bacterium]